MLYGTGMIGQINRRKDPYRSRMAGRTGRATVVARTLSGFLVRKRRTGNDDFAWMLGKDSSFRSTNR